jgi:hypothetical protein
MKQGLEYRAKAFFMNSKQCEVMMCRCCHYSNSSYTDSKKVNLSIIDRFALMQ